MSGRLIAIAAGGLFVGGVIVGLALWGGGETERRTPPASTAASATTPAPTASAPAAAPPRSTDAPRGTVPARGATTTTPPPPAAPDAPAAPATPTTGTLRITSDVPGASVFIDRVYLGTTPMTAENVAPGSHRLNVSADGYDGIAETIEVAPGPRDIEIKFKEVKLDATLQAVHKHGVGSCHGTLHATPRGLTYAASDGGDRFDVPLTFIETFEVDYIAKNLRVKIRGGKTFNFTDPEGNADRLFVFHRDVDKARKRLSEAR